MAMNLKTSHLEVSDNGWSDFLEMTKEGRVGKRWMSVYYFDLRGDILPWLLRFGFLYLWFFLSF